jgi:hypothetical protein
MSLIEKMSRYFRSIRMAAHEPAAFDCSFASALQVSERREVRFTSSDYTHFQGLSGALT